MELKPVADHGTVSKKILGNEAPQHVEKSFNKNSISVAGNWMLAPAAFFRLIRIRHWVKNLFLFVPSFFAGHLFKGQELKLLIAGTLAFSLVASGIYIVNDYKDRHIDKIHPKKKNRPIASGEVKEITAKVLMILFITTGLVASYFINTIFLYLLLTYAVFNLSYSFGLKNIAILDLFIVASGFLLRIYSGGAIASVPITNWLAIMIFLLALFLVTAKRRDDLVVNSTNGEAVRKVSKSYNIEFINSCLTLLSAVIIVAYIMYTVSRDVMERFHSNYLFITAIFVIAGVMRYLQITLVEQNSGSPTRIFYKDKFILITILCWIVSFFVIIYAS